MASESIKKYIEKRYYRWLDYAQYHCSCAGIADEAVDVLNEVLLNLLQKPDKMLNKLLEQKKDGYTGLDFFVLRMIKLNATSPTSPYRYKYRAIPTNENVDYSMIEIEDEVDIKDDNPAEILKKTYLVREVFEEMTLTEKERYVFTQCFFCGEKIVDIPNSDKSFYDVYKNVRNAVTRILSGLGKTERKIDISSVLADPKRRRENEIVEIYFNRKIASELIDKLYLSDYAIKVFSFKFFSGGDFKDWDGKESIRKLNAVYDKVSLLIQDYLDKKILF